MEDNKIKKDLRVWHPIFLWGTVCAVGKERSLVEFDFKECEYYIMGRGYVKFTKENTENIVHLPNSELYNREIRKEELSKETLLKMKAMNATVKL